MAHVAQVSSTSPVLTLLLTRSCKSLLQKNTCCFSSQYIPRIDVVSQKRFTILCAKASEQRRKTYMKLPPSQQSRQYSTKLTTPKLERPEVIFSNNHVLVVNKPPGWKSQPGDGGGKNNINMQGGAVVDPKCLLTYLKSQSLGGGSQKDFLIPAHRIDQPCTGVLIFAKNGKAASRVQVAWSKRKVKKCYWVVVEDGSADREGRGGKNIDDLELLRSRSVPLGGSGNNGQTNTHRLSALLKSAGRGNGTNARGGRSSNNAGGSVMVKPLPPNLSSSEIVGDNNNGRVCHIEWQHLLSLPTKTPSTSTRHLLSVTTDTGAKHQVRALLALAGNTPIAGDLRYGNNTKSQYYNNSRQGRVDRPLPDGSVALHARSVLLPTVSLGGMEFLKDKPFVASIPKQWRDYFGVCEDDVRGFS